MFTIVRELREMVSDIFIDCDDVAEFKTESDAVNVATWLNQSEAKIIASDPNITAFTSYVVFSDTSPCIEREDLGFAWEHILRRTK